ncbi:hypothetical protein, conserved [Trypanosoma brucei gambiense DAL972]|uniref:Thioredoxin domain-containing protein n=1 Tax=Trypanosoma brucei gambiense (strain MHOM/CI/86/DAL972) TaxID=679716 RepID=C9ZVC4_TRYB9|nr:hypothetical protein, conserved [Trypanosoma brucei gambiense DAL972]CBH13362.1 hypothetical protein, conserved [Trypanosoma brucei gambiense DAL972]|eukprot:XP_011775639.1 hypothetical protein, conserved [Trypanosoma brucei gambiense DAL972]
MEQMEGHGIDVKSAWVEFTAELCDELNDARCLGVAAATPEEASGICALVDEACASLVSAKDEMEFLFPLNSLMHTTRVCFTNENNIKKLEECTAVYGRVPMIMLLEMKENRSFVLDFTPGTSVADVEEFLSGVARGTVAKALQGAAPPSDDHFQPVEGITLRHGLCAVTSTIERLKHQQPGGALCIFWSHRCSMCPHMMLLLDASVGALRRELQRHGTEQTFTYMCCDVDENDLPEEVFPRAQEGEEVTVPQIVAFNSAGERFVYDGRRTAPSIMSFAWEHCVPKEVRDATDIKRSVMKAVESVCIEELLNSDVSARVSGDVATAEVGNGLSHGGEMEEKLKDRKRPRCVGSE